MSASRYHGRHRPASRQPQGRRHLVLVIVLAVIAAGVLVIRGAGATQPSADAAARGQSAGSVAGMDLTGDPAAVAAAGRNGGGISRDAARRTLDLLSAASGVAGAEVVRAAAADRAAANRAAAAKEKAARATAALAAARRWVAPLSDHEITSGYGWRWGRMHAAEDFAAPVGTPVRAMSSGVVLFAGWDRTGYGHVVRILHWDGTVSLVAHNSRLLVSFGDRVSPGQPVAISGDSGRSTGPHVHLEIHPIGGGAVPPHSWLAARGVKL